MTQIPQRTHKMWVSNSIPTPTHIIPHASHPDQTQRPLVQKELFGEYHSQKLSTPRGTSAMAATIRQIPACGVHLLLGGIPMVDEEHPAPAKVYLRWTLGVHAAAFFLIGNAFTISRWPSGLLHPNRIWLWVKNRCPKWNLVNGTAD